MMIYHDKIKKKEINPGVIFQYLGKGNEMMFYHWNMADGSEVAMHTHESEQFGYCIKGGFVIIEDGKRYEIGVGDAYIIPANVPHPPVKSTEPTDERFFKRLMTWNEFKGYVDYLNEISYGGFNDWRVPSKHELRSLINYSNINPAYQKGIFKTVVAT